MRERWKGIGEGGIGQLVYTLLALVCLVNVPMVATFEWGATFVLLAGVFLWLGWINDD